MKLTTQPYNILEFTNNFKKGEIVVNKDYQRSHEVWSSKARSYLIETILLGFSFPKLCLYQKTNIKTRTSIKEIVDGQQRTAAIVGFLNDEFAVRADGEPAEARGRKFSQLSEDLQRQFLEYQLSVDFLVGATDEDIRELFRRMNSYTAPLNAEEQRHAKFQGDFKWFVLELCKRHTGFLRELGAFTDRKIVRMADARLYSEVCYFLDVGLATTKGNDLDSLYEKYEKLDGKVSKRLSSAIGDALDVLGSWESIRDTSLLKKDGVLNILIAAIAHHSSPVAVLNDVYKPKLKKFAPDAEQALAKLADSLELDEEESKTSPFSEFITSSTSGTNVKDARETKFRWISRALDGALSE